MKKILFLFERGYYFDYVDRPIEGYEIRQEKAWRNDMPSVFAKILRNLSYFTSRFTIGKWKDEGIKYDGAIFPDWAANKFTVKYFGKHPIADRQILYYRNALDKKAKKTVKIARKYGWEVYTYNTSDVRNYGLKYNSQCWNKKLAEKVRAITIREQDVYFLGQTKSRYQDLCAVKKQLEEKGFKCLFRMVSNKGEPGTQKEHLSYKKYLIEAQKSIALLDIVEKDNWGLTLRPLEGLFLKKKIITNYTDIVHYDFYPSNKDNIFILNGNDYDGIEEFLKTPFKESGFDLNIYDKVEWMKRFFE